MPNTGIPPPPFLDPCMGGRGGARGEPQERLRERGKGSSAGAADVNDDRNRGAMCCGAPSRQGKS